VRIIRTCHELGIETVAVYSEADRAMPHVLLADEAYLLGPSPSADSYLRGDRIIETALNSGADAIHPGYGFLSEKAPFARAVHDAGVTFIGPPAEAIAAMGDKTAARAMMISAGVPVVPGTEDPVAGPEDVSRFGERFGYPILIKAAAGGGGKGMRVVHSQDEIPSAYRGARSEAMSAFGDDRIYVERYLPGPRHIEFQILADAHGNVVHLGERECSIQRRHQKIIEESPSVIMNSDLRKRMGDAAVMAAKTCGYLNAGTIEFLVDRNRNFYFLEMNTRLQVEHPVTELRTGLDLVAEQIMIASNRPLSFGQEDVRMSGHAIECRIYAEDPSNNYLPSTGTVEHLKAAQGPGVRDDRGVEAGNDISVYYDPMISKLITSGKDRAEALRKMVRALMEYEVLGVATNIPLNLSIMTHPDFIGGEFDTHFLASHPDILAGRDWGEPETIAAAAVALYIRDHEMARQRAGSSPHGVDGTAGKWARSRISGMRGGGE